MINKAAWRRREKLFAMYGIAPRFAFEPPPSDSQGWFVDMVERMGAFAECRSVLSHG